MSHLKILLLGKNGQVGWELQRALAPLGEVIALDSSEANFLDSEQICTRIKQLQPNVIVNAAAYTAVDKAESEPDAAKMVNATTIGAIAAVAKTIDALLVHYSTDYVFNGSGNIPHRENDLTDPLSVYGATKLEGEQLIQAQQGKHLIFRTSWVYAARGNNFAKTMLKLAKDRAELNVIDDQFGAPTGAELIADVTVHAIQQTLNHPEKSGLYHLVASGETTWNQYARFVIDYAITRGVVLQVTADKVNRVDSSAFVTAAKRPLNSRLSTQHLQSTFGLYLPSWQSGVQRMLDEYL